jgi:plasmid stabilization system protein ParE
MDSEFQEWPISFGASGYVALYRLQQDTALVVAVRHQKEVGYQPS